MEFTSPSPPGTPLPLVETTTTSPMPKPLCIPTFPSRLLGHHSTATGNLCSPAELCWELDMPYSDCTCIPPATLSQPCTPCALWSLDLVSIQLHATTMRMLCWVGSHLSLAMHWGPDVCCATALFAAVQERVNDARSTPSCLTCNDVGGLDFTAIFLFFLGFAMVVLQWSDFSSLEFFDSNDGNKMSQATKLNHTEKIHAFWPQTILSARIPLEVTDRPDSLENHQSWANTRWNLQA